MIFAAVEKSSRKRGDPPVKESRKVDSEGGVGTELRKTGGVGSKRLRGVDRSTETDRLFVGRE